MEERKLARELLRELGVDPIRDLAQIVKQGSQDLKKLTKVANSFTDPECQIEALKVVNSAKQLQVKTLRDLSSICEKEDDQLIKLKDHDLRKKDFDYKKERDKKQLDNGGERQIIYVPADLKVKKLEDGREVVDDS